MRRLKSISGKTMTMHIAYSEVDSGICSMLWKAAERLCINVTGDNYSETMLNRDCFSEFEHEGNAIDCLVCSSELHPAEVNLLDKKLKEGISLETAIC